MQSPKNMKMMMTFLAPQALENSLFPDVDPFWLHFSPQVASRPHLGAKMMRKWIPGEPPGPRNHEKVMKMIMEF